MATRWKVLAIVFLARTGLGIQFQTLGSLGGQLQDELALSLSEFGLLVGLFMLAGVFLSFPAGLLGRWATDRLIIASGLLLLAFGGLIGTIDNSYALLSVGRIISGVGFVLGTLYFAKVIGDWFAGQELATAMGVLVMSWPIGIAVAQVSVPWFAVEIGWKAAFYISSTWCFLGAIAIAAILPARDKTSSLEPSTKKALQSKFTSRNWTLTFIAAVCWGSFNAGFVVYLAFIDVRFAELGFQTAKSAGYASLPSWIMPVSAIVAGLWVDRTGARYLSIIIASIAAFASMLVLAYTSWSLVGVLLFGIIGASAAGVIMALTVQAIPAKHRAFGMGVFFTLYFISVLPAPAIAGRLADLSDTAASALTFAALLFAMTGVSAALFRWYHAATTD